MRNLALRRTKTQQVNGKPILDLPARNVVLKKLTLNQEQRETYDLMENEGKILIRGLVQHCCLFVKETISLHSLL